MTLKRLILDFFHLVAREYFGSWTACPYDRVWRPKDNLVCQKVIYIYIYICVYIYIFIYLFINGSKSSCYFCRFSKLTLMVQIFSSYYNYRYIYIYIYIYIYKSWHGFFFSFFKLWFFTELCYGMAWHEFRNYFTFFLVFKLRWKKKGTSTTELLEDKIFKYMYT